ncbi:MAG: metallophosphoesterase [Candidatus Aenigmatarchaeota archaeon]
MNPLRILVMGDFEGSVPNGLKNFVKREKIDCMISPGDFSDTAEIKKIEFGNWGKRWAGIVGKEKAEKLIEKSFRNGIATLKVLDNIGIPVYCVYGNNDVYRIGNKKHPLSRKVSSMKNVRMIGGKTVMLDGFTLAAHGGYRGFGQKKDRFEKVDAKTARKIEDIRKKWRMQLRKLLEGKRNVMLLTHDVPYMCKLDMIRNKKSPLDGKHIGDELIREAILRYKPVIHLCGHMHENQGTCRVGKTTIINGGFGRLGQAAILELPEKSVKFVSI